MTNDEKRIIQLETENSLLRDLLREERNRKEVSTAPIWPNTAGINNPPFLNPPVYGPTIPNTVITWSNPYPYTDTSHERLKA